MDRRNSEGIMRHQLKWALTQRRIVAQARNEDRCLLCRQSPVNEAGICKWCVAFLDDDEQKLVERWMAGVGP